MCELEFNAHHFTFLLKKKRNTIIFNTHTHTNTRNERAAKHAIQPDLITLMQYQSHWNERCKYCHYIRIEFVILFDFWSVHYALCAEIKGNDQKKDPDSILSITWNVMYFCVCVCCFVLLSLLFGQTDLFVSIFKRNMLIRIEGIFKTFHAPILRNMNFCILFTYVFFSLVFISFHIFDCCISLLCVCVHTFFSTLPVYCFD